MSELAKGFYSKPLHQNAPDFVKARFSVKAEDAIKTIQENVNEAGYVNLQILEKKDKNGLYVVIDDYKPAERTAPDTNDPSQYPAEASDAIDSPF